jgi:hypothetical protein
MVARIMDIKVPDHVQNQMQGQSEVLSKKFQLKGSGLGPKLRDVAVFITQLVGSVSYDCIYRTPYCEHGNGKIVSDVWPALLH